MGRKENVFTGGEFTIADRYLPEGAPVHAGDCVMDDYKLGYSPEITMSLWRTRQDIYRSQLEVLGEARDVELRNSDNEVERLKQELSNAVLSSDTEGIMQLETELTRVLADRSEYLRATVQETENLRSLYKLQDERETAVADSRIALTAEQDGLISYYFDDYSVALTADKLSTVTAELIDNIINKTGKAHKWTADRSVGAYRIVDDGEWYLVFNTAASQGMRVVQGESYPITISGYGSYEGVAQASFVSGGKIVNIIKVTADIGSLIDARTVQAEIGFAAEGICVETRAVQLKDGEPFIEVMTDGKRTGVYVDVHSDDGSGAIVSAKNTAGSPLSEGVKYWIPKKRIFKK